MPPKPVPSAERPVFLTQAGYFRKQRFLFRHLHPPRDVEEGYNPSFENTSPGYKDRMSLCRHLAPEEAA